MSRATSPKPKPARGDDAPVVVAQGLTKVFKDFWLRDRARAVDGIDFQIHRGEIFGLLGPNGSGKSTTIKMILGLLKLTKGRLVVLGKAPNDVAVKKRIGYLPEESYLYPFLNARETLEYYGKLFSLERRVRERRIDELLEMVGLSGVQTRQVREYSKGMQRRIGIAQALINDPEFLILDEPTTGLDPLGARQVKDLITHLGERGKTILLSSHLLADVEDCVHRMVILYGGRIRAQGSCDDLLEVNERSIIETDALDAQTLDEIRVVLERRGQRMDKVSRPRQRLEDLFVGIVERARAEHIATSGAESGGTTAAFLMGLDKEELMQGESLIDQLVRSEDTSAEASLLETESRRPAEPAGPDPGVIETLVGGEEEPAGDSGQGLGHSDSDDSPRKPADVDVDEDLIQGLLGRDKGNGGPRAGGGQG